MEDDDVVIWTPTPSCTLTSSPPLPPRKPRLRIDLPDPEDGDCRLSFFGRRRSAHTWVVSLFVVINIFVFVATMLVNNCPRNSGGGGGGQCVLRLLGRFSFQPLYENPLLGPSSSTLVKMGALQRTLIVQQSGLWRLVTSIWLHSGVIHLIANLSSMTLLGNHLEQEYGSLRAAMIYVLCAFMGSVASAVFVEHIPAVGSSGALFGFIGAMVAGLLRNWDRYAAKFSALVILGFIAVVNFGVGLLPHVDNFSSLGGFISGVLLGLGLLYNPELSIMEMKRGLFSYDLNKSVKLKQKLDSPLLRIISLLLFILIFAAGLAVVLHGIDANKYCRWCQYINCVPSKMWSCKQGPYRCEAMISDGRLTLTCLVGGKFRTYPFANISQERMDELCSLLCS